MYLVFVFFMVWFCCSSFAIGKLVSSKMKQKDLVSVYKRRYVEPDLEYDDWKEKFEISRQNHRTEISRNPASDKNWLYIEDINRDFGIARENSYIDDKGYLRWKENSRLCHRDVAFKNVKNDTGLPFRYCDVHHLDGNKWNNNPSNLKIMKRNDHQMEHGEILFYEGKMFTRFARRSKIYKETSKSIMIARTWIEKSDAVVKDGYVYVSDRILQRFGKRNKEEHKYAPANERQCYSERTCGRTTCSGCPFYNNFDMVCQK